MDAGNMYERDMAGYILCSARCCCSQSHAAAVSVSLHNGGSCVALCRAQELGESQGDHPGLSAPNSPYSLYGRKATLNLKR